MTINQLRADPILTERVSAGIDQLGLSSSDSEDEGVAFNTKKHSRGKKLWSGKTAKLTSRVIVPQLWPHNYLSLAYVSKTPEERTARLDHFVVLMYLVTQFAWPTVREFLFCVTGCSLLGFPSPICSEVTPFVEEGLHGPSLPVFQGNLFRLLGTGVRMPTNVISMSPCLLSFVSLRVWLHA